MSTRGRSLHTVIDDFVGYLNGAGFEPRSTEDVPLELRTTEVGPGLWRWQIQSAASNPWVEELSSRLPQKWPDLYLLLIERYRFCEFEVGPVMFFANTGLSFFYELADRISRDPGIFPLLRSNGHLQFGIPHAANYDPVCFDMRRGNRGDAPIVQLDHEEILIRNRIRVVQEIAPSFAAFAQRAIAEKLPVN